MKTLKNLDAAFGRLYEIIGTLVGISIAGFVIAIAVDLFLRLFKIGTLAGVQELIEYTLFTGVFLTAPWLLRLGAHVRVDLLLSNLPRKALILFERIIDVIGIIICLAMAWFSWINLSNSWIFNAVQRKYFNVPEWILLCVVLASFVLLATEFIFRFFRAEHLAEELDHLNEGM